MSKDDPQFYALLRAEFRAPGEMEAVFIADQIKVNGEVDLDPEDGDTLDVLQVSDNMLALSPEESVVLLRRARNFLISTKVVEFYQLAQEIDKAAYSVRNRTEQQPGFELAGYDYASWIDTVNEVLEGKDPIEQ